MFNYKDKLCLLFRLFSYIVIFVITSKPTSATTRETSWQLYYSRPYEVQNLTLVFIYFHHSKGEKSRC